MDEALVTAPTLAFTSQEHILVYLIYVLHSQYLFISTLFRI